MKHLSLRRQLKALLKTKQLRTNSLMYLSVVCPTQHTWGRCWRKKADLLSESSLRGEGLVHCQDCPSGLSQTTQMGMHTHSLHYVKNVFGKFLCEFHKYPNLLLHTLCMAGRFGGYVGEQYAGLCPRYGGLFHQDMSILLLPPSSLVSHSQIPTICVRAWLHETTSSPRYQVTTDIGA